jgi:DNA-binding transcriptional MerR regulator
MPEDQHKRPMYGNIKDIRGCFSLSENGFRLYERAGLVHPVRNEANGYRMVPLSDGVKLCNIFSLTRMGMSLKQTRQVLSSSVEEEIDDLDSLNEKLSQDLQLAVARKARLESIIRSMKKFVSDPHACTVGSGKSLWFAPLHNQQTEMYPDSYDTAVSWWKSAPLVDGSLIVTVGKERQGIAVDHGPGASASVVSLCSLPTEHAVHFCTEKTVCVQAFVQFRSDEIPTTETYAHIFDYMDKNHLSLEGNAVMHRLLRHIEVDGIPTRIDEVYFPLVPITK